MRKVLKKVASVFFAIVALIGIGSTSSKAVASTQPTEKAPLYLEHSEIYHWTEGGTHWSHGSHSSHYSSRY